MRLLIDAHVHIHDCFDLGECFDHAYVNFKNQSERMGPDTDFRALLCLTESAGADWYGRLSAEAQKPSDAQTMGGAWKLHETEEPCALRACSACGHELTILSGRQIVTAEGLEVLSLMCRDHIADGSALQDTVKTVEEHGGIPVIPWGAGKWLGQRGRILERFLDQAGDTSCLALGDNGGRPVFWKNPRHFLLARSRGIPILPGSDPLPLPWESARIGSFGFSLEADLDHDHIARELRGLLCRRQADIHPYGCLQRTWDFVRNQWALRFVRPERASEPGA